MWHAQDRLFVHAGVVAWDGRGILIPGRSFSGKSTLVRALVDAGATYYSDEYALLDHKGRVHPYPVPLSIRSENGATRKISDERMGGERAAAPLPVGLIVVTQYRRGARWRPRSLSRSEAFLALMDNTIAARREPEYTMPILREVVLRAAAVASHRAEARRIAPQILDLLPALSA
jgi:hypothetical protein